LNYTRGAAVRRAEHLLLHAFQSDQPRTLCLIRDSPERPPGGSGSAWHLGRAQFRTPPPLRLMGRRRLNADRPGASRFHRGRRGGAVCRVGGSTGEAL